MSAAVPYQRPRPPAAAAVMRHYARSEAAGWYTKAGPCALELAEAVAGPGRTGVPVASGTTGLALALRALAGVPRPERPLVAMPSFTCPAVGCAVVWAGFTPLWLDVDEAWQPAARDVAVAAAREDVAAVVAPATFGVAPARPLVESWAAACSAGGVPLVLDLASAFTGAPPVGGDALLVSFGATKPTGAAEGAVVACADPGAAERLRVLAGFGMADGVVAAAPGLNGHLSELHAAAALARLDELPAALARRRDAAARVLAGADGVELQPGSQDGSWPALHLRAADAAARAAALAAAARLGVEVRTPWDPPLHRQPGFAGAAAASSLERTTALAARSLALPVLEDHTDAEAPLVAAVAAVAAGR